MSEVATADRVTEIRGRLEGRGGTNNNAIARFYTYAPADIAFLLTQLSQALLELEAARSHGSALLRDVEHAEAQRDQALLELGEARDLVAKTEQLLRNKWNAHHATVEQLVAAHGSLATIQSDRDAALRSTAELTRERDDARASVDIYNDVVPVLTASNAELRGALERINAECESSLKMRFAPHFYLANIEAMAMSALASSSTTKGNSDEK